MVCLTMCKPGALYKTQKGSNQNDLTILPRHEAQSNTEAHRDNIRVLVTSDYPSLHLLPYIIYNLEYKRWVT